MESMQQAPVSVTRCCENAASLPQSFRGLCESPCSFAHDLCTGDRLAMLHDDANVVPGDLKNGYQPYPDPTRASGAAVLRDSARIGLCTSCRLAGVNGTASGMWRVRSAHLPLGVWD